MSLVLIGPPAAGKSRVGKRVARRLGLEHIDTDKAIVARHGPIPAIFAEHGEEHFRQLERTEVARALAVDAVVSLGGGAVLDAETARELRDHTVVLLMTEAAAIESRIANGKRPLVTSIDAWQRLLDERLPVYRALADHTIDTSRRPVEAIVRELAEWMEARP